MIGCISLYLSKKLLQVLARHVGALPGVKSCQLFYSSTQTALPCSYYNQTRRRARVLHEFDAPGTPHQKVTSTGRYPDVRTTKVYIMGSKSCATSISATASSGLVDILLSSGIDFEREC